MEAFPANSRKVKAPVSKREEKPKIEKVIEG